MAEIKLSQDSSLLTRNTQARISKSSFMNWSTGRKSATHWCVCCPDPCWQQAGSAFMHCTTCVQQGLCFPKSHTYCTWTVSPVISQKGNSIELLVLKDTFLKVNSFTQKSKMLNRKDFLFLVKSQRNNVVFHLESCGMNL